MVAACGWQAYNAGRRGFKTKNECCESMRDRCKSHCVSVDSTYIWSAQDLMSSPYVGVSESHWRRRFSRESVTSSGNRLISIEPRRHHVIIQD